MHKKPAVTPPATSVKQTALPLPAGALLVALLAILPAQEALADCTATAQSIHFGNVNLLAPSPATAQGAVSVTCTKTASRSSPQSFNVCLAVDGGQTSQQTLNPKRLCKSSRCSNNDTPPFVTYDLYHDPAHTRIWSTPRQNGRPIDVTINVPAGAASHTVDVPFYAKLIPPFTNVTEGIYSISFGGGSTSLSFGNTSCGIGGRRFAFTVTANVIKNCIISEARDINFGTVQTSATNLQGQSSFKVTCTQGTPYKIGLQPSNNNQNGQGVMRAVQAGNPDGVPYQLRSTAGLNGTVWGNTATAQSTNNGVAGTGSGTAQKHDVYATISSVNNYRPGEYRDRVIINVHY